MCLPPLLVFGLDPSDKDLLKKVANYGYFGFSILNHYKKNGIALIRKLQSLGLARQSKEYSKYGNTEWTLTNCGQRAGQLLIEVEDNPLLKDKIISDYKFSSCKNWLPKKGNPTKKLLPLLKAVENQIDFWLKNPPLVSINNWIKGKEGEIYIRYNSKWDRLDLATFNIKEKYQGKGVTKSIIQLACSKNISTIRIENILEPSFSAHLEKYKFLNRKTVIIPHDLGIVSIDFTKDKRENPIKRKFPENILKELINLGKVIVPTETGVTKLGIHWAAWVEPNFVAEIRIYRETFTEVVTWHIEATKTKPTQWKKQFKIPGQLWPPFKNWWADNEFQELIQS